MLWLYLLCSALTVCVLVLSIRLILIGISTKEICAQLKERMEVDTNTLITLSGHDKGQRRLAAALNVQLRQLRKERRRLQNSDMELREAITNIAHDIRSPLTAICGYMDLLEKEEKSEAVSRYLGVIGNRVEAMKQLTEELFHYSVLAVRDEMHPERIDIKAVLEESVSAFYAPLIEQGITPVIKLPEERIYRLVDKSALSRVLGNVLGNALKYSDGDLEIELTGKGELIFSNAAAGLDEVQVGKLFDRFYTVENARRSTGLGLSIAKLLTEQMGGSIAAQYREGRVYILISFPEKT